MQNAELYLANIRFGLGGPLKVSGSAHSWLLNQLSSSFSPPKALRNLDSSTTLIREYTRRSAARSKDNLEEWREQLRTIYEGEVQARLELHRTTKAPFRERLVQFWSNHFTVSINKAELRALAGSFEREAIRPHVTGRFYDLLEAATQHPAMLLYLDNVRSIGPNSMVARGKQKRGLNENHARELLELHTLGVNGGYTQSDVEALARLLTGWGIAESGYAFDGRKHEPGEVEFLGYAYPDLGESRGKAALRDLSRHPSTATFLATKLCRHFLSDDPDAAAVERIAQVFRETDGDLAQVSAALVNEPEAWEPFHKYKSPYEYVVSALRALQTRLATRKSPSEAWDKSRLQLHLPLAGRIDKPTGSRRNPLGHVSIGHKVWAYASNVA